MLMLLLALHPAQAAKNLNVEQSQLIEAPAAVVWQYVANFETWKDWTVWNTERDPEAEWTYGGEAGKAGHSSEWAGKELGKGRMVATEVEPEAVWNYDLYFGSSARSYPGGLTLEESDGTTLVTWSWNMKMSGLGKALFGNRVADKVAQDFAGGLDGLELAVEAAWAADQKAQLEAALAEKKAASEAASAALAEAETAATAAEEARALAEGLAAKARGTKAKVEAQAALGTATEAAQEASKAVTAAKAAAAAADKALEEAQAALQALKADAAQPQE